MLDQALFENLAGANHNPDILSCLANLSNDEVFTPPQVANAMLDLLPPELFRNPETTFLDPVAKTGVFLREIVKRLMTGLADVFPDPQKRLDPYCTTRFSGLRSPNSRRSWPGASIAPNMPQAHTRSASLIRLMATSASRTSSTPGRMASACIAEPPRPSTDGPRGWRVTPTNSSIQTTRRRFLAT